MLVLHSDSFASVGCKLCYQHFGGTCCLPLQGWSEQGDEMLGYTGMGISNHYTVTRTRMGNKRGKIEMHSLIHYYLSSPLFID